MEIIKSIKEIKNIEHSAVTLGNFDGVHKGHQVLIYKTVNIAKTNGIKSVVFTFENHPANYFKPGSLKNIMNNEEKLKIFESMGVDVVVMVPFDKYMTTVDAEEFVKEVLVSKLHTNFIVVGHDFNFAKNKTGNSKLLKSLEDKYKFDVDVVSQVLIGDIRVSSSYIRELISNGEVDKIQNFLGKNYTMSGEVVHAKEIGRTIGFPTANIKIDENILCPKIGIYASRVLLDDEFFFGATNVGFNPTVSGKNLSIETHILDFDRDIYGKVIEVEFLEKIRNEIKFDSLNDLKEQLKIDTGFVRKDYSSKINFAK
ncbi:MAG: bifunctional riboflavin kinase/FAD synthetase [Clostridioides sp.]|jgi:riboflavin kinase/FMN adenylyltransferase|nr:bifunctional riboflavin kinase/FAD synthetase [Clostridioides sp.]